MAKKPVIEGGDGTTDETSTQVATVRVRVLTQCTAGPTNSVQELPIEVAQSLKDNGWVDDHPDAVAYADSLAAAAAA